MPYCGHQFCKLDYSMDAPGNLAMAQRKAEEEVEPSKIISEEEVEESLCMALSFRGSASLPA